MNAYVPGWVRTLAVGVAVIATGAAPGCGSSEEAASPATPAPTSTTPQPGKSPGAFAVSRMQVGSQPQNAAAASWPGTHPADTSGADAGAPASFDMGDLKGSDDFLFLLKNAGDFPITDVSLSSDGTAFEVAPASISSLEPASSSAIETVLRVRVVHGTNLSGVGHLPVLPMGPNQAVVSLNGKTRDDTNTDIDVSLTFTIKLNALLADFEASVAGAPVDLMNSSGGMQGVCLSYGTGPLSIRNTGNVPLVVKSLNAGQLKPEPVATATVAPGASTDVVVAGAVYGALIDPQGVTFKPGVYDVAQGAFGGGLVICSLSN